MAVDRDKVKKQMAQSKQRSGKFRYLPKDSTTTLRMSEFKDEDGSIIFARPVTEHREVNQKGGKSLGICREETLGKPCAFCRINQQSKDGGEGKVYESKTRYAVCAADINDKQLSMRPWMLPVTAYEQVAEFVMDDEWADILEAKGGTAFNCKREGSGLDTTYTVKPQRNPYPLNKELMAQVSDPIDSVVDVGLKAQCEELGFEMSDLFDDSEIEEMGTDVDAKAETKKSTKKSTAKAKTSTKKSSKKKTSKKKTSKKSTPAGDEIGVGSAVKYEDEEVVYHVKTIDDNDVEIEDDAGEVYEATMDQIALIVEDAEPEPEPEPVIEKGSEIHYDGEDAICTVKSIKGENLVIEDADGEQYDVKLGECVLADLPF